MFSRYGVSAMPNDPGDLRRTAAEARERQAQAAAREQARLAEQAAQRQAELAQVRAEEKSRLTRLDVQAQAEQLMRRAAASGSTRSALEVGEYEQLTGGGNRRTREQSDAKLKAAIEVAEKVAKDISRTPGIRARAVEEPGTIRGSYSSGGQSGNATTTSYEWPSKRVVIHVDVDPE